MAWQEPFTDWSAGALVTPDDMNRITGNLNYLLDESRLKTNYTADDYVFLPDWEAICTAYADVAKFIGASEEDYPIPDADATSHNFNLVETFCADAKETVDRMRAQKLANKYVGEWYADTEIFTGGVE